MVSFNSWACWPRTWRVFLTQWKYLILTDEINGAGHVIRAPLFINAAEMVQQRLPNEHQLGCSSYRLKTNSSQRSAWVTGPQEVPKPKIWSINLQCRKCNLLFPSTDAARGLLVWVSRNQPRFSLSWKQMRIATRALPDVKWTLHISQIRGFLFDTTCRSLERAQGIMLLKVREERFIFTTNWRQYLAFFCNHYQHLHSKKEVALCTYN